MANTLQYPSSLGNDMRQNGQHCVLFESYETKSALATTGSPISAIALFIPPGSLTTSNSQNFEGLSGAQTTARTGQAIGNASLNSVLNADYGQVAASATELTTKLLAKPQAVRDVLAATKGLAVNNHSALVYRGPGGFRSHTFNFTFTPKNENESNEIQRIVQDFTDGSNPSLVNIAGSSKITAPFFKAPRQYKIKFLKGGSGGSQNNFLFEINTSVITSMTLNFDPNSVISFHPNGAPVTIQMGLSFQEIEYKTVGVTNRTYQNSLQYSPNTPEASMA